MDSDRWKQVDSLLQAALERPAEERDAFLRHACAGDEALEREVRSLLASQQEAGSFLESPAIDVAARALGRHESRDPSNAAQESGDLAIGATVSRLGPYEILAPIGAGGMGAVYKACDTRLNRMVAIKVLLERQSSNHQSRERFEREARAISSLSHPHICPLFDVGHQAGVDYLVMEYLEGETLAQKLKKGPLPLEQVMRYAIEIADALDHAHRHGVIHRDLKPGNIMLTKSAAKVLDFGLAKVRTPAAPAGLTQPTNMLTEEGTIVGTLQYMAPEQLEAKEADARTDIFAFGAVLYEMATGKKAFEGKSQASLIAAILEHEPAQISSLKLTSPPALDWVVKRCLAKDPDDRVQTARDLKSELQWVAEQGPAPTSRSAAPTTQKRRWPMWAALAAAVVVGAALTGYWRRGSQASPVPWKLTRVTNDSGLSDFAALSPDGKLVAYASDRSLDGEPDLYIKQVAGGQPIRLTSDGAGNTTPDFSPDSSSIVFRSNRDGGGVYEIPAFGGDVRLVARDGLNPKFSPDGSQVAYWVGDEGVDAAIPGGGTVWVVPVAGGPPQRVGQNFTAARHPIWSPDGKHLLFVGYTSEKAYERSGIDWWLAATNGGDAVKTGAHEALVHAGLQAYVPGISLASPACWPATANKVTFSTVAGDTDNLWEIGMSPGTGRVSGVIERLTTGAGHETHASCAPGGALAFTNGETRTDVWLLPFDLDRGVPKSALERATQGPSNRSYASLSNNGRYVAFGSDQSGRLNIWIRDLVTGKESSVATSPFVENYPVINASGTRIAFSVFEKDKRVVYVSAPGGVPEKLCEGCLRATDWSRDEKTVLVFGGNPYQVNVLDLASHRQTPLLKHPTYNLLYGRFSPDNRWASFTVRTEPNRGYIAIAPVDGPQPVPENAWITIAPSEAQDWANWSPDGKTLYFTSRRDGHSCLWGQRLETSSHRPAGEPFAVQHLHGRVSYKTGGWSAAGGRIGLVLSEDTGNIWMMSR
jgi:eukaryotic-like serine/threonine-protein kinase